MLAAFLFVLLRAGCRPGDHVSAALHDRATTTAFLAIVSCLAFAAALTWVPPLQPVFGTAGVPWAVLVFIASFPLIVWGVDELRRDRQRRAAGKPARAPRRYTDDAARAPS